MKYYVIWYHHKGNNKFFYSGWIDQYSATTTKLENAKKYSDINYAHNICNSYNDAFPHHSVQEVDAQ